MSSRIRASVKTLAAGAVLFLSGYSATTVLSDAAAEQPAAPSRLTFSSETGLLFTTIKADQTRRYEEVIVKLKEALAKSETDQRRQQAVGWTVYRALEPGPNETVIYLSVLQPAVREADYYVFKIISEAFPSDAQALYRSASGAFVMQSRMNLQYVTAFK